MFGSLKTHCSFFWKPALKDRFFQCKWHDELQWNLMYSRGFMLDLVMKNKPQCISETPPWSFVFTLCWTGGKGFRTLCNQKCICEIKKPRFLQTAKPWVMNLLSWKHCGLIEDVACIGKIQWTIDQTSQWSELTSLLRNLMKPLCEVLSRASADKARHSVMATSSLQHCRYPVGPSSADSTHVLHSCTRASLVLRCVAWLLCVTWGFAIFRVTLFSPRVSACQYLKSGYIAA